jgi:hypothetical protein
MKKPYILYSSRVTDKNLKFIKWYAKKKKLGQAEALREILDLVEDRNLLDYIYEDKGY